MTLRDRILSLVVVCTVVLALGAPTLLYPFGRDQGEYAVIAQAVMRGRVVYRDVFNVKPPLTHMIHQLALVTFGQSMMAIRLLDLFWQLATSLILAQVAYRVWKKPWVGTLAACLYAAAYYRMDFWSTAQTDGFITLPVAIGVWVFYEVLEHPRAWYGLVVGLMFGITALLKYPIGIILILFIVMLVAVQGRQGVRNGAIAGIGFGIPLLFSGMMLWIQGSLTHFLDIQLGYIPSYSGQHPEEIGYITMVVCALLFYFFRDLWFLRLDPSIGSVGILAIYSFIILLRQKLARQVLPIGLWWLAAAIHLGIQNKFYTYHALPLIAPQAFLVAGLAALDDPKKLIKISRFIPLVLLLFMGVGHLRAGIHHKYQDLFSLLSGRTSLEKLYQSPVYTSDEKSDYSVQEDMAVASYLNSHSEADDLIFIWGFEPTVYFLAQRDFATRFLFNYPLYGDSSSPELRSILMGELTASRPEFFIVVKGDALRHVTGLGLDSQQAFKEFEALYNYITAAYVLETTIGDFSLYRLNR